MIAKRHWLAAGILTLALHALLFAAFARSTTVPEGAKAPGEGGVEIDLGMLGDLGAETETRQAEPAPVEPPKPVAEPPKPEPEPEPVQPKQTAEVAVEEPPKQKPEPEPEPEPAPEPEPEPEPVPHLEAETTPEPVTPPSSQAQADTTPTENASATAARKARSGKAESSASGGNPGARSSYLAMVAAKLARAKRYPRRSRLRRQEGVVGLSFTLDRQGRVVESSITTPSAHSELNKAVIRMLENAAPLPAFPDDLNQSTLSVSIPVAFKLSDSR